MWETIRNLPSRVLDAFRPQTVAAPRASTTPTAPSVPGGLTSGFTPQSLQAQAARYQGQADALRTATTPMSQMSSWERGMTTGLGNTQVAAVSPTGIPTRQPAPAVSQNMFSDALRRLNTSQQEYFDSMVSDAEQRMGRNIRDIDRQEQETRSQAGRMMRSSRAAGTGRGADLRSAAAARGLMSSPASFDVGLQAESDRTMSELASTRSALQRFEADAIRARADQRDEFAQFMEQVRRQRLAQQQQNEAEFMARLLESQRFYFG